MLGLAGRGEKWGTHLLESCGSAPPAIGEEHLQKCATRQVGNLDAFAHDFSPLSPIMRRVPCPGGPAFEQPAQPQNGCPTLRALCEGWARCGLGRRF